MPSEAWESAEVRVGRHECAAVLNRYSSVLGVRYQLSCGTGLATYRLENVEMVGSGAYDARVRTSRERRYEGERLVESGRRFEDSWVGCDANETGQDEY